jgi:myosin regulatory light chain 12
MSSRKTAGRRGTTKKRAQRATSNVFAMFDQAQIQEFKEAFNMIDQNRDGFVDKEDLHDMLASLGNNQQNQLIVFIVLVFNFVFFYNCRQKPN